MFLCVFYLRRVIPWDNTFVRYHESHPSESTRGSLRSQWPDVFPGTQAQRLELQKRSFDVRQGYGARALVRWSLRVRL